MIKFDNIDNDIIKSFIEKEKVNTNIDFSQIGLTTEDLKSIPGFDDCKLIRYLKKQYETFSKNICPSYYYAVVKPDCFIISSNKNIEIKNNTTKIILETGFEISNNLIEAKTIALVILTLGQNFDIYLDKLYSQNDVFDAYIFDVLGTITIERCLNLVYWDIKDNLSKHTLSGDFCLSKPYSPGNNGWDIKEQSKIFLFFKEFNQVKLLPSMVMSPIKSLTAIVGIGQFKTIPHKNCSNCHSINCHYRTNK